MVLGFWVHFCDFFSLSLIDLSHSLSIYIYLYIPHTTCMKNYVTKIVGGCLYSSRMMSDISYLNCLMLIKFWATLWQHGQCGAQHSIGIELVGIFFSPKLNTFVFGNWNNVLPNIQLPLNLCFIFANALLEFQIWEPENFIM